MTQYRVFHRTWWKIDSKGNKVPGVGKDHFVGWAESEEAARAMCRNWNAAHDPGPLSDKAEYERAYRKGLTFVRGTYGARAYSYDTCIFDTLPDGRTVGNVTKYSATTTRHQKDAGATTADVQLSNVPKNTDDLAAYYLAQQEAK